MDESEIPDYTRNWLRAQHGETLRFRSTASGQVRVLTVARAEGVVTGRRARGGKYKEAYLKLRFRDGQDSLLNLNMDATANEIQVGCPNRYFGRIATHSKDGHTAFYSGTTLRIVAQDTVLGKWSCRYLGRIGAVAPTAPVAHIPHPTDTVTAVYISRYEGLVGFTTKRGGLWERQ